MLPLTKRWLCQRGMILGLSPLQSEIFVMQVCKGSKGRALRDQECWGGGEGNIQSLLETDADMGICSAMQGGNTGNRNLLR